MTTSPDRRTVEHTSLTDSQRSQRARIAARARWAREDGAAQAALGQAGLVARFEREVDPDGVLPPRELARRVESAKREHFTRLAYLRSRGA